MAVTYNFIQNAKNNPDNKVTLLFTDPETGRDASFSFFLSEKVSLGMGNKWDTPLNGATSKALGGEGLLGYAIKQGIAEVFNSATDLKHFRETIKFYQGSESLDLDFTGILIASSESEDLMSKIRILQGMCNPDFDPSSNSIKPTLTGPLGYAPNNSGSGGKIAVKIGRWFFTGLRYYLIEKCTPTPSLATLPNGKPMYIGLSISLTPFRLLSLKEVRSFLK